MQKRKKLLQKRKKQRKNVSYNTSYIRKKILASKIIQMLFCFLIQILNKHVQTKVYTLNTLGWFLMVGKGNEMGEYEWKRIINI